MTPDKNFRMNRTTKVFLATAVCKDAHRHSAAIKKGRQPEPIKDIADIKKNLIDAQLREEAARREALKTKETSGVEGREAKGRTRNSRSSVDAE